MNRVRHLRRYFFGIIVGLICQAEYLPIGNQVAGVMLGILLGVLWTSLLEIPWGLKKNYAKVARDAILVFAADTAARLACRTETVSSMWGRDTPEPLLWTISFLTALVAFGVVAYFARKHILTHLGYVLLGFWMLNCVRLYLDNKPFMAWILSLLLYTAAMWLAFAASRAIRKAVLKNRSTAPAEGAESKQRGSI